MTCLRVYLKQLKINCRCSLVAKQQLPKLWLRVRFPSPAPKKSHHFDATFLYQNRRFGISSRFSVHLISSFGAAYHHASACIFLRLDDIPLSEWMIYNFYEIDDMQDFALISVKLCDIINSTKSINLHIKFY